MAGCQRGRMEEQTEPEPQEGTLEPKFPLEFIVRGTPVALGGSPHSRDEWKKRVYDASRAALPEGAWATEMPIALTIFYFPNVEMQGDIDNIVKYIADALKQNIFFDDHQMERVVVQKFEPGRLFRFANPSITLGLALTDEKPLSYIRISTDPHEELR